MKISQKIINIRNSNNLTQDEFAEILFVTRQTVSNWENNKCYPDIETLIIISDKFNISLDILLKEDRDMIKKIDKKVKSNKIIKIALIVLSIIVVLMIYCGYKLSLLDYYSNGYGNSIINDYVNNLETISITTNKDLANTKFENMNIYIPEGLEEETYKYEDLITSFYTREEKFYITIAKQSMTFRGMEHWKEYYYNIDYNKIFEKYEIKNELDLIKYFEKNYQKEKNIFSSKSSIQMDLLSKLFVIQQMNFGATRNNKHYYLTNDISGYLNEDKSYFTVYIYNSDENYVLEFKKDIYSLEEITNILNSIYFE